MYRELVTDNIILRKRLIDIGPISTEMCRKYGATGPVIRGSGVPYDVRRVEPYSVYPEFDFDIPVFPEGDSHGALPGAHGGDGPEPAHHRAGPGQAARRPGHGREGAARAEAARRAIIVTRSKPPAAGSPCGSSATARKSPTGSSCARRRSPTSACSRKPAQGMLLPDALALMGSLDLVIPDIDR